MTAPVYGDVILGSSLFVFLTIGSYFFRKDTSCSNKIVK